MGVESSAKSCCLSIVFIVFLENPSTMRQFTYSDEIQSQKFIRVNGFIMYCNFITDAQDSLFYLDAEKSDNYCINMTNYNFSHYQTQDNTNLAIA